MPDASLADAVPDLLPIADQFAHGGGIVKVIPLGNGNINDTFLVQLDDPGATQFVLQKLNRQVFRHPEWVMQNMRVLTDHVHRRLQTTPPDRRWEMPRVIATQAGQDHWTAPDDSFWRALSFIAGARSVETVENLDQAQQVGYALGMFHHLVSDLPPARLADTLEGFHITPSYLQHYHGVMAAGATGAGTPEINYCHQFITDRAAWVPVLETAKAAGKLPMRLMHGDPKINNVMFDVVTHQAVSMIDLDTVKPGLVHYDIGDCLRSGGNPAGEETRQWETVQMDLDLCQGILQGYFSVAKYFFTDNDYEFLFDAIRLIAFELGLRFFTDYLAGDVYFKVKYPEHNLVRALVQFKLTASIESQSAMIRTLIQDLK
jgi:Ser/Thr protein kinase RdoA (MazF antagonist)